MRVLFCSQAAHTGGGVETWMEALTAGLEKRGVEVFTALAKGHFHDPTRYAARHHVANPIPVDGSAGYREVRIANLLRVFDRVQPDVIIPVHLADALFAAVYAKTRGSNTRIAICIHGQTRDRIEQVASVAPFVDLAASVSRRVANELAAIVPEVRHIPTGVDPPLAVPTPRDHIANIGYIGRLDQSEKHVLDAIALMKALDGANVTLHIVGSGPDEAALRAIPAVFHGQRSRRELYESIYPMLDALVVFSEAEAGPIVAWEAMIHGVVPIVSDYIGRVDEAVIRDGETGRVFPFGDMRAAASAIRALTAPGSLRELSQRTREELPGAYTTAGFEQSWFDALTDCVAQPSRSGVTSQLPPLVSPGRFARLGLGVEAMAKLRRLARRTYPHDDPGSEWPH